MSKKNSCNLDCVAIGVFGTIIVAAVLYFSWNIYWRIERGDAAYRALDTCASEATGSYTFVECMRDQKAYRHYFYSAK